MTKLQRVVLRGAQVGVWISEIEGSRYKLENLELLPVCGARTQALELTRTLLKLLDEIADQREATFEQVKEVERLKTCTYSVVQEAEDQYTKYHRFCRGLRHRWSLIVEKWSKHMRSIQEEVLAFGFWLVMIFFPQDG